MILRDSTSAAYATLAERGEAQTDVPFGWFDAPPSLNRLLGVQWLARLLHPTLFPEPLSPAVKAFHTLHYHRTPSHAQLRALMESTGLAR